MSLCTNYLKGFDPNDPEATHYLIFKLKDLVKDAYLADDEMELILDCATKLIHHIQRERDALREAK